MARVTVEKSLELEQFWRSHLEAWQRSELRWSWKFGQGVKVYSTG
jgi:hypothetical protein